MEIGKGKIDGAQPGRIADTETVTPRQTTPHMFELVYDELRRLASAKLDHWPGWVMSGALMESV